MRWAGKVLFRLLHPPRAVLCLVPPLSFAALCILFLRGDTRDAAAYVIYTLSAYSLVIWVLAAPKQFQRAAEAVRVSGTMQRIKRSAFGGRYLSDLAFHGSVGICQGMVVNFFYVVFRLAIVNVVRFRALRSPILSAAKVLNLVSALMSLLGLQTAMIARFSPNGEKYRKLMNTVTGSAVYAAVIVIAVYMLRRSRNLEKEGTKS